jgi:hypothetical protein
VTEQSGEAATTYAQVGPEGKGLYLSTGDEL